MSRKPIDMTGERFGRLVVISDTGRRNAKGEVFWLCQCDCGGTNEVIRGNLRSGTVSSCGCLAKELTSARGKARAVPHPECSIDGCAEPATHSGRTLCQKHDMRVRRYGDPTYVTPEDVRRESSRNAQLARVTEVKPTTYRKLFGRHEHRVIGEQMAGRPLRSDEHVHHIDEDKHNNDPSNLMVLPAVEHLRLHAQMRSSNRA